ncbi:MAG: SRPBCC domain-containing protein [Saprospiraceae bacterium]
MRIIKFLLKFLAVLLGLFLLSGVLFPKTKYTTTQKVDLPLETAFDLYTDATKMKHWYTGLQSIRTEEQKPGVVGNKYKLVTDVQGKFIQLKRIVTKYKKPQQINYSTQSIEMIKEENTTFQNINGQTLITNEANTTGKSYLLKCLHASFFWIYKNEDQAILDSFKIYAERN